MNVPPAPAAGPVAVPAARSAWGDRTVKTKVLATVALSAAVAAGIGALGIAGMSSAADDANELYASNLLGSVEAAKLEGLLGDLRVKTRDALIAQTPTPRRMPSRRWRSCGTSSTRRCRTTPRRV